MAPMSARSDGEFVLENNGGGYEHDTLEGSNLHSSTSSYLEYSSRNVDRIIAISSWNRRLNL